jgi:hypothetical protein
VLDILRDDRGTVFNTWRIDAFTRFITVSLDTDPGRSQLADQGSSELASSLAQQA